MIYLAINDEYDVGEYPYGRIVAFHTRQACDEWITLQPDFADWEVVEVEFVDEPGTIDSVFPPEE